MTEEVGQREEDIQREEGEGRGREGRRKKWLTQMTPGKAVKPHHTRMTLSRLSSTDPAANTHPVC